MKQNSLLRQEARTALKGKWGISALAAFTYLVIYTLLSVGFGMIPFVGSVVAAFITAPLAYGYAILFLHTFRGQEIQFRTLFCGYNQRIWVTTILKLVYTSLWTLLLIVPGIIKQYSYAMTEYILHDNPELSNNKAIEASMAMMQGQKGKLFLLDLSFIGWYLLGILTLGIGWFWVLPYHQSARAAFYEDIKPAPAEAATEVA